MNDYKQVSEIINKEMYFVHKGTWDNDYQWRIEKVKIRSCSINEKGELFVNFGFNCTGYEYPFSYLKATMKLAKKFAIQQIIAEKKVQMELIEKYPD